MFVMSDHVVQGLKDSLRYNGDCLSENRFFSFVNRSVSYSSRMTPGPTRDQILSEDYILSVMHWAMIDVSLVFI